MTDLVAFLTARLDEDEVWALEASRVRGHLAKGGVHWQWVHGPNWDPVTPDPTRGDYLIANDGEYFCGNLISVEEFPWSRDDLGTSPQVVNGELRMQDVHAAAAGHIIRHHPARVLRDVAAKRMLLEQWREAAGRNYRDECDEAAGSAWAIMMSVLVSLAGAHQGHPEYAGDGVDDWTWPDEDPAWRPE